MYGLLWIKNYLCTTNLDIYHPWDRNLGHIWCSCPVLVLYNHYTPRYNLQMDLKAYMYTGYFILVSQIVEN